MLWLFVAAWAGVDACRYKAVLDDVLELAGLKDLSARTKVSPYVSYVMLYDMLLGRGIRGGGVIKRSLTSHKVRLTVACMARGVACG